MRRMEIRSGYVKFWRLGTVEFGEQSRWGRAPRSRGLWAFPYPFYDSFFTYHKYLDLVPKRFRSDDADYEAKEEWINTVGRKVLPIREFWYRGDVMTHFMPNGDIGSTGLFDETDWSQMAAVKLTKLIVSSGATTVFERYGENKESVARYNSSVDHLEVFIAPGMGKIRDKAPGIR